MVKIVVLVLVLVLVERILWEIIIVQKNIPLHWLLLVIVLLSTSQVVAQSKLEGYWATSNFGSVVRIKRCKDSLCANIVWLWEEAVEGRRLFDGKNSDAAKKNKSLIGLQLFKGFKPKGNQWKGRIYNPEDGRRYRATIKQSGHNVLRLKGCWGPFCQSQRWRRLSSIKVPSEADLELRP